MIYLLYGSDADKARAKAQGIVDSLLQKKPDVAFFKVTDENWDQDQLDTFIGGQGLFVQKNIVHIDGVLANKEVKQEVLGKIKEIGQSDNIFVFREGELDKATVAKFEKNAEKVQEFTATESVTKKPVFNIFTLGDAIGRRDRKSAWVLYMKAKQAGLEDEQIHGTLFWQVKSLLLAADARDAKEAGLNPYVYSKAKSATRNFRPGELARISENLITIYHESRRGGMELGDALEKFLLEI